MNKVAFITGASRGIGKATALAFARAGYDLIISARTLEDGERHSHGLRRADGSALPGSLASTAAEIRTLGRRVREIRLDLLDDSSVLSAADVALRAFGRVDVLVNNAIYQGSDLNLPFLELEPATLKRVYQGYVLAHPAVKTQQHGGSGTAQQQGCTQGKARCDAALAAVLPSLVEVELDTRNHHKQHDRPPSDAVEGVHHGGREHKVVVRRKPVTQHTWAEHDAHDDLHHHQRGVVVGVAQAPDQPGDAEDDQHRDEKNFGGVHGRRPVYSRKTPRVTEQATSTKPARFKASSMGCGSSADSMVSP